MRSKLMIFFLLLLTLTFAVFTAGKIIFLLTYEFAIFILLNYLYLRYVKNSLDLYIIAHEEKFTVGEEAEYEINLINNSFLPVFNVEIRDYSTVSGKFGLMEGYLASFKNKKFKKKFTLPRRGIYFVGPFELKIQDPFGIFTRVKFYDFKIKLKVFPKVRDIKPSLKAAQQLGIVEAKNRAFEDYTNMLQLRKYVPGDSIKRIHWKVSAKKGELYAKEFQISAMSEVYLLWDLNKGHFLDDVDGKLDEECAECMVSVAKYCLLAGIPVNLLDYPSGQVQVRGRTIRDFGAFMEASIKNFPVYDKGILDFEGLDVVIPKDATLVLITPYLDSFVLNKLHELQDTGVEVLIYYVNDYGKIKDKIDKIRVGMVFWRHKNGEKVKGSFV
ncbi:MAG: hypothetical protein XD49_1622 [Caldanaerobacter subterraneus]|uniref:DUF58 domain-containing protein n=3 Tax=Caldanaerobacter subterraneus TaxID=911092 RepID=Q8R823_CALS4|nr:MULTISPECIES: DUF58 domain-containing protein [Caldanaerobacter]AAM25366.1 conserved hypothetical protein [Caldanaerobacter subterraneus subsp. tengcongensis MB4]KUK08329.1 MAG: hypothetical protein XD49_1622 [Caldanaerobacter subterraneus]MBE3578829.1 DUF58 domain-containing protein [Caldanaerobacter subterraneus]MCS3915028.1 uncharacterized protein (DUF58 family) [Caldanaerobacter subterraneus subsp. tengcongensis MB4]MDI3518488.1 hypothetical protein [Caldanaerobacter sp.]